MATIIDGRGNISKMSDILCVNTELETPREELKPMTIEEYRNLELTPEQEWNNTYNPKRCSIEALDAIEIKKRGKGSDKKIFYAGCKESGPYYDPGCFHLHIWKKRENIQNFIGEQFQNIPYVQFTDNKPGVYCTICHARNKNFNFKWTKEIPQQDAWAIFIQKYIEKKSHDENIKILKLSDFSGNRRNIIYTAGIDKLNSRLKEHINELTDTPVILQNTVKYKQEDYLPVDKIKVFPNTQQKEKPVEINNRVLTNWDRVANRVLYSLYNNKIVYPLSNFKSLYLWPWQLTPYQKFKLNNPSYNISSNVFVKSENSRFQKNYAVIV